MKNNQEHHPSRGGEGATEDPSTSPKVTYGKKKYKVTKIQNKKVEKTSETKVTTNKTETKKQSLGDRVKKAMSRRV